MIYAEIGLPGVINIVIVSPVLLAVFLVVLLWKLNMRMGNINPPWYKLYMEFFKVWSAAALELFLISFETVFHAVYEFLGEALLVKMFLTIPLCTVILHGCSILRGESDLIATLIAHDLLYFVIDIAAREFGTFDHSGMIVFLLFEITFSVGRVGMNARA